MCIKNIFHIAGNMENSYNMHIFIYYNPLAELNQRIFYPPTACRFRCRHIAGLSVRRSFPIIRVNSPFMPFVRGRKNKVSALFLSLSKGLDTCSRHWQAVSPCTRPDSGSLPAKCREHLQHRAQAAHAATGA